jgi:hypothetical protein
MSEQEVKDILYRGYIPVVSGRKQDSQISGTLFGSEWHDLGGQSNAMLFNKYFKNLTEGQACHLWENRKGNVAIITLFSEDDKLLQKEFRYKQHKSFLERLIDLVWQ